MCGYQPCAEGGQQSPKVVDVELQLQRVKSALPLRNQRVHGTSQLVGELGGVPPAQRETGWPASQAGSTL
jgi:hypothetical protein